MIAGLILGSLGIANAEKINLAASPSTIPGSVPTPMNLDMNKAIQIALENSKTMKMAVQAVQKAHGKVLQSKDNFLPSVNFNAVYSHLDSGASVSIPGPNGKNESFPVVLQDQGSLNLVANMPVDIMGLIGTAVDAAQFQEIAARLDYNRARNQLVLDVETAYLNVLRAKAYVTVSEQALKNAQDSENTSEIYLKEGTGTRFEVLRAQTTVANAKQNLISARNQVNLTTAVLANVMNVDQNTPITVTETQDMNKEEPGFDQALAESYKTRPEVLQADANIHAAEKGVKLAASSSLPSLGISWTGTDNPATSAFSPKSTSWVLGAQITVPIFDQGISNAKKEQAHADVNSAKLAKGETLDGIALEVRQAYLALTEAKDRLNVTNAGLVEAEEQYRLAQVRFKEGVTQTPGGSPLLEISDALTALTQAQINQVNAKYDVENAQANLEKAIGLYAFSPKATPGYSSPSQVKGLK
jgi:outer membrane protein TolC